MFYSLRLFQIHKIYIKFTSVTRNVFKGISFVIFILVGFTVQKHTHLIDRQPPDYNDRTGDGVATLTCQYSKRCQKGVLIAQSATFVVVGQCHPSKGGCLIRSLSYYYNQDAPSPPLGVLSDFEFLDKSPG